MKIFTVNLFVVIGVLVCSNLAAQEIEFPDLDPSPMDMAHYPPRAAFNNYLDEKEDLKVRVMYSRPKKKDRTIFGGLVPYGQSWRMGANEGTEITFFVPAQIGGSYVAPGTYTIRTTVYPNHWEVILSTQLHVAGSANMDASQEFVHAKAKSKQVSKSRESFTMGFQKVNEGSCNLVMAWDRTVATLPISFNPAILNDDDNSPMDLAQYPSMSRFQNFLEEDQIEGNQPKVRVVYSRPQVKGRKIFGELLEYGKEWRIGANETTEIIFFDNVKIGDTDVKKGRYGIFCTVNEDEWTFVIHKNLPSWGPANHDAETNVATISVPTAKTPATVDALSIVFEKVSDSEVNMVTAWENTMTKLPIMLK